MQQPVMMSLGLGTNSVAMAVEKVNRREPLDALLFADTGGEKPATYDYQPILSEWLVAHGYPAITVVRHTRADGSFESLEDECLRTKVLPSIAYGPKRCSGKFKMEPQAKWANGWQLARAAWKARIRIVKLVGYTIDERHRAGHADAWAKSSDYDAFVSGQSIRQIAAARATDPADPKEMRSLMRKVSEAVRYEKRYPLIEWSYGRDECIEIIRDAGLPQPGKSACFFCPSSKPHEIRALSSDLQERALHMERNAASGLISIRGLGRSFSWDDVINPRQMSLPLFVAPPIPCECVDDDDEV